MSQMRRHSFRPPRRRLPDLKLRDEFGHTDGVDVGSDDWGSASGSFASPTTASGFISSPPTLTRILTEKLTSSRASGAPDKHEHSDEDHQKRTKDAPKHTHAFDFLKAWFHGDSVKSFDSNNKHVQDYLNGASIRTHVDDDDDKPGRVQLLQPKVAGKSHAKLLRARKRFMAVPDDEWYIIWTLFTMLVIVFVSLVNPVRLAFNSTAQDSTFCQGTGGWWILDAFIDIVFLVDIALILWTVVPVPGGSYITQPKAIFFHHVTTLRFWIDAVSSIPTSLMAGPQQLGNMSDDDGLQATQAGKVLRMNRLVKLLRIFRLARFLREVEKLALVSPGAVRLGRLIIYFVSVLHFLACLFWIIGTRTKFCDDEIDTCSSLGWSMSWSDVQAMDLKTQYANAFFFAVTATTGVGYDLEPTTYEQFIFTSLCILLGVFVNAFIIGSVPGALEYIDRHAIRRQEKMDMLDDYMRVTQVPLHMQKSVRSYFDFVHEGDLDHALDPSAVLKVLPESISSRIRVATHIKAIEGVELFNTFLSPTCRIMLAARLHTRIGTPGEYLYVQGDLTSEMFIIDTGKVQLTRVISAASSAKKHFSDAVKKLNAIKLLSSISPSSRSTSDASSPPKPPLRRRSSLDVVESALESVRDGLKTKAKKFGRGFSNEFADGDLNNECNTVDSDSYAIPTTPKNTSFGSFDNTSTLASTSDSTPQGKTPVDAPQGESPPGGVLQDGNISPSKDEIQSPPEASSNKIGKPSDSERKSIGSSIVKDSGGLLATSLHVTGNHTPKESGSQDGRTPPLVLGLGPGDFFGEAAVLGQKQSTSALSTEYSTFQIMRKTDVDDICCHFPELSTALQEVANLRSRQFLVKTSNPLKDGDLVKVIKEGSSLFGRKAKVVNSDWNGLVKVTLIGESAFKTYKRNQLELDVSILLKFKKDDLVKIIKHGSNVGKLARVEDPAWNDLVKVRLVGEADFKSYHRYELESASDADIAAAKVKLPTTSITEQTAKIDLRDNSTSQRESTVDDPSPWNENLQYQFSTPLSPTTYSTVRGAAKKWLAQIKEKEACDDDSDVNSIIGEESLKKTSGDCPQFEADHTRNEVKVAPFSVDATSKQIPSTPSYMDVAHQKAEAKLRASKDELVAFLKSAGLLDKAEKFLDYGIDSIDDAFNPELVSNELLQNEFGFTEIEVGLFRSRK